MIAFTYLQHTCTNMNELMLEEYNQLQSVPDEGK